MNFKPSTRTSLGIGSSGCSSEASHVAKRDGTAWSALSGPAGTGADGSVRALTVYDDGMRVARRAETMRLHDVMHIPYTLWPCQALPASRLFTLAPTTVWQGS